MVTTAAVWLTTPPDTYPFFHQGEKNPLHSAFHLLFSQNHAWSQLHPWPVFIHYSLYYCPYPCLRTKQAIKCLSHDGHFIATTACSAVLNINGFRKSGCLLVSAPLIKKPIRNSWANPTFQSENWWDQLEKDNEDLKMFSCSFFFIIIKAVAAWLTESRQQ